MESSNNRPKIAVSGCLLGLLVRYDGRGKHHPAISKLSGDFELIPICPEVGAGLTVPRPPVQLVQVEHSLFALGVENRALNITEPLKRYFDSKTELINRISGMILKTKSPSCGVGSAPLFNFNGRQISKTSGLFAAAIQHHFPDLPIIDDRQLNEAVHRKNFFHEISRYQTIRQLK